MSNPTPQLPCTCIEVYSDRPRVVTADCPIHGLNPQLPATCPECGHDLEFHNHTGCRWEENFIVCRCENDGKAPVCPKCQNSGWYQKPPQWTAAAGGMLSDFTKYPCDHEFHKAAEAPPEATQAEREIPGLKHTLKFVPQSQRELAEFEVRRIVDRESQRAVEAFAEKAKQAIEPSNFVKETAGGQTQSSELAQSMVKVAREHQALINAALEDYRNAK